MAKVILKAGRIQPLWAGHPWVFAQAIDRIEGAPSPGDLVELIDPKGKFLGWGYWSPRSAIPVRILSRSHDDTPEHAWLGRSIEQALTRRKALGLLDANNNGARIVHGEGDQLPGLIVDLYNKVAVLQFLTVGMKRRELEIIGHIQRLTGASAIIEAGHQRVQQSEGFGAETRVVRGPEVSSLHFRERAFEYDIPLSSIQRTGYYFDRREARRLLERLVPFGARVLDLYAYAGSFSLTAARAGAHEVMAYDASPGIITAGAKIARQAGYAQRISFARAKIKSLLPELLKRKERYDIIIVDPPMLSPSARHLDRARRAYRSLNASAMRLLKPGGLLLSISSSIALEQEDFLRLIAMAARDAGREASLIQLGGQALDHPAPPAFPEGRYLKSAFLQVR